MPERFTTTDPDIVPASITCIDCGGTCHLITVVSDEQPLYPGDVITYRCEDCRDRWDLVVSSDDDVAGGRYDE